MSCPWAHQRFVLSCYFRFCSTRVLVDNLCNILFLCYNSMNLVRITYGISPSTVMDKVPALAPAPTELLALEIQTEPGTAQPWVSVCSQVLLLLGSPLLGGGTSTSLAVMCSSSQSLPFLKTSSMYLPPLSPGMPASKPKQHTPTGSPFQLAHLTPGSHEIISVSWFSSFVLGFWDIFFF